MLLSLPRANGVLKTVEAANHPSAVSRLPFPPFGEKANTRPTARVVGVGLEVAPIAKASNATKVGQAVIEAVSVDMVHGIGVNSVRHLPDDSVRVEPPAGQINDAIAGEGCRHLPIGKSRIPLIANVLSGPPFGGSKVRNISGFPEKLSGLLVVTQKAVKVFGSRKNAKHAPRYHETEPNTTQNYIEELTNINPNN